METNQQTEPVKKNRLPWIIGGILLIVVLMAAAFLGGRMLNQPKDLQGLQMIGGPDGGPAFSVSGEGGEMAGEAILIGGGEFTPAEELPKTQPDAAGVFTERKDNSLFLGTGNMGLTVMAVSDGTEPTVSEATYDGPVVEIVVTGDTIIYRDATQINMDDPSAAVQQVVEPGDLEDITTQSMLTVWGKKTGDRIIADIIFYANPFMMTNSP